MNQQSLKQRLESVQAASKRLEEQLRPGFDRASAELKKVLQDLGADLSEPRSMAEVVSQIRSRNPSLRAFALHLDAATYDLRKKLWWDANMMTAYVTDKAGKTYQADVRPMLAQARSRAEAEARKVMVQLRELTARRAGADEASTEDRPQN